MSAGENWVLLQHEVTGGRQAVDVSAVAQLEGLGWHPITEPAHEKPPLDLEVREPLERAAHLEDEDAGDDTSGQHEVAVTEPAPSPAPTRRTTRGERAAGDERN